MGTLVQRHRGPRSSVLITGAGGFVGRQVAESLASSPGTFSHIVATDVHLPEESARQGGVAYVPLDITDRAAVLSALSEHHVDTVVHLAAVVTPRPGDTRASQYDVDVRGTENVLEASVACGVRKLVYTSSGAAYGYHADNAPLLRETDALRGNQEFAYAWHKRLVEERLETYRAEHPELAQLVLRVSTILGPSVHNQITAMFERPVVLGLRESETPFCFVWDRDVVDCICLGVHGDAKGTFNLTGDGVMTLREIAQAMGQRFVAVPAPVVEKALSVLTRLGLSPYGPEQVAFLRYRPVLDNDSLKRELGFTPRKSSRQTFELYREHRA